MTTTTTLNFELVNKVIELRKSGYLCDRESDMLREPIDTVLASELNGTKSYDLMRAYRRWCLRWKLVYPFNRTVIGYNNNTLVA